MLKVRALDFGLDGLRGQIVGLFLGLLLLIQAVGLLVTRQGVVVSAEAALSEETNTAERVLVQLLSQREARLQEAATTLAADVSFQVATSENGAFLLGDVLAEHLNRSGASVVVYTDSQFRQKGASRPDVLAFIEKGRVQARKTEKPPTPDVAKGAGNVVEGKSHVLMDLSLAMVKGQAYQVVAVPVKSPQVSGWVMMGQALDQTLLNDLRDVAGVHSALLHRYTGNDWQVSLSTLPRDDWFEMGQGVAEMAGGVSADLSLEEELYRVRFVSQAADTTDGSIGVLLLRTLDEVMGPYRRLQWMLLLINLVGLVVAMLASVGVARRIALPIETLQASARRLGSGDYTTPVQLPVGFGSSEVSHLAAALDSMRSQIQSRERQVQLLAYWDPLTKLPNNEHLRKELARILAHTREGLHRGGAVLMLDLDRFKHVNDVLGHPFGDRLMIEVAQRLSCLWEAEHTSGMFGRYISDEFVFLVPDMGSPGLQRLAQAIQHCLQDPIHLEKHVIDVGAVLGAALFPDHGDDADQLLGRAEIAMYEAKRQRAPLVFYNPKQDTASQAALSLMSELRVAVSSGQLRLFLQPKIHVGTGAVLGAEALVRWQHPERGLVPPGLFIPFAEQTGFIRELTAWMLTAGVQEMRRWRDAGLALKLSINMSTRDLLDSDLPRKVATLLAGMQVDAGSLCLEITESAIMEDPQGALQILEQLHQMGLLLSIDDFGTGYSSLAYLKRLPVDELKIDRSFVMSMENDVHDIKIVRSTIDLAHNLGMTVVAEGVETAKAWLLLNELQCDEAQGYYIAKPMPAAEFMDWVENWRVPTAVTGDLQSSGFSAGPLSRGVAVRPLQSAV